MELVLAQVDSEATEQGMRGRQGIWRAVAVVALAGALVGGIAPGAGAGLRARDRAGMLELTNRSREARDIRALELERQMSRLAYRHSLKMARRGELFHTADPARTYLRGTRWRIWGENVGVGNDLDGLQDAFMDSAPHRHNILRRGFRHVAIGVARAGGRAWVTVFFYG